MKIDNLKVSCVSISEYGYDYRGIFILSNDDPSQKKSLKIDLTEFESDPVILKTIKSHFDIDDPIIDIKNFILQKVIKFSGLSSKDVQGENFNQDPIDQ